MCSSWIPIFGGVNLISLYVCGNQNMQKSDQCFVMYVTHAMQCNPCSIIKLVAMGANGFLHARALQTHTWHMWNIHRMENKERRRKNNLCDISMCLQKTWTLQDVKLAVSHNFHKDFLIPQAPAAENKRRGHEAMCCNTQSTAMSKSKRRRACWQGAHGLKAVKRAVCVSVCVYGHV